MREGWTETTLGDIASWSSGKNLSSDKRNESGLIPILGANGIIGRTNEILLDMELITVGRVGACGETHRSSGPVWVSDNALIVIPTEQVNIDLLFYILSTFSYQSIISGTTQPLITQSKMKSQVVTLPPIAEQKRIVDVVSSVDAYIDALQQQVATARTAGNAVLHELLSAGGDDWIETTLGEVLLLSIGGIWGSDIGTDEIDVRVYRQTEFNDNGRLTTPSDAIRSVSVNQLKSRRIKPGDVLLQKSAGTPTLPGRVVRVPEGIEDDATCSNFLQLVRADSDKCISEFLFWELWFRHKSGGAYEFQRGTNIRNLDLNQYFSQSLHLPPIAKQQWIVEIVSSIDDVIQAAERAVVEAKNLRSGLLSDLLSGEHEMPVSYDEVLGAA